MNNQLATATPSPSQTQPQQNAGGVFASESCSVTSLNNQQSSVISSNNAIVTPVTSSTNLPQGTTNVVTIPVPIVNNEETYCYVCVKGSLHDRSCSVFGLNETEVMAIIKRFDNGVKPLINGVMVSVAPMEMLNTLAELGYKVICSCGEAEISWTMQREI